MNEAAGQALCKNDTIPAPVNTESRNATENLELITPSQKAANGSHPDKSPLQPFLICPVAQR